MPQLTAVHVSYGASVEIRFDTSKAILEACDTAVLQVSDTARGGSELAIRVERGWIADASLWDAGRCLRQQLALADIVVEGRVIRCRIPLALAPRVIGIPTLEAALVVNGAPVQSRFPVTLLRAPEVTPLFANSRSDNRISA